MIRQPPDLRRAPASRAQRRSFLVFHDPAAATYLQWIKVVLDHHQISLRLIRDSPVDIGRLVRLAARERRDASSKSAPFDEVWCLLGGQLAEADRESGRKSGISFAISDPIFELWPLLHFVDEPREWAPAAIRHELGEQLGLCGMRISDGALAGRFEAATERAKHLRAVAGRTTDVHEFVERVHRSLIDFKAPSVML